MYWFLDGSPTSAVPLALAWLGWMVGGWLLARRAFRLEAEERFSVGIAVGLGVYLFVANLAGRWADPQTAFLLPGLLVLLAGIASLREKDRSGLRADMAGWPLLVAIVAGTLLFTLIGRGLAILDDRKNLSLISLMAAGDIPPHFYMNPVEFFRYHYAFQLLGASAMRLGGLFPWSAFDLTKGFAAALSLAIGYLAGKRLSHRSLGGWIAAGALLFAGSARWLLLLAPPGFLDAAGNQTALWGSAAAAGATLRQALMGEWVVAGGPPQAIPFAYLSGVLEPFVLGMQAGPGSLSRLFLVLMILLLPRMRRAGSAVVLTLLLATWALAWEAGFVLFAGGMVVWSVLGGAWRADGVGTRRMRWTLVAVVVAGGVSLVQGGTLTEMARASLAPSAGSGSVGELFALRWPPALVSSHFGELRLDRWPSLAVALAELGAPLAFAPLVIARGIHWGRRGRFELALLAMASLIGALAPLVVRYRAERDISRLTAFSLLVWVVLAAPLLLQGLRRRRSASARVAVVVVFGLLVFSGLVVLGSVLTALPRGVFTEKVAALDAGMARRMWDGLPTEAIVFDSHPWRSIVLTGRPARSSLLNYDPIPEWSELVVDPSPGRLARAGYTHVYADEHWLRGLTPEAKSSFDDPCLRVMWSGEDNADNGTRQLFDITGCIQAD